jgi:hypothetical protein
MHGCLNLHVAYAGLVEEKLELALSQKIVGFVCRLDQFSFDSPSKICQQLGVTVLKLSNLGRLYGMTWNWKDFFENPNSQGLKLLNSAVFDHVGLRETVKVSCLVGHQ